MPCSPRRRIRLVTVTRVMQATLLAQCADHHELDTSNGCQDHTVCPSATSVVRLARGSIAHRRSLNGLPALRSPHAPDAAASTASRPNVRDDGQRPSQRGGTAGEIEVIWAAREGQCFCARGWTGSITLDWLGKLSAVGGGPSFRSRRESSTRIPIAYAESAETLVGSRLLPGSSTHRISNKSLRLRLVGLDSFHSLQSFQLSRLSRLSGREHFQRDHWHCMLGRRQIARCRRRRWQQYNAHQVYWLSGSL
jgi:hypothetical protein